MRSQAVSPVSLASLALLLAACSDSTPRPPDARAPDRAAATEASPDGRGDRAVTEGPHGDRGKDATPDLAPGTGPFRIVTFNVQCLLNDPATRIKNLAAAAQKLDPDTMILQEVCQSIGSNGSDNFAGSLCAELKKLTGVDWDYAWSKASISWINLTPGFPGYEEGVAVVARKAELADSGWRQLPPANGQPFPRKLVWGRVATPRGGFYAYSLHLVPGDSYWQIRVDEVKDALVLVNQHLAAGLPQVIAGDFNDKYCTGPLTAMTAGPPAFTDAWASKYPSKICSDPFCDKNSCTGTACGCTESRDSNGPTTRIDYIFIRSAALKTVDQAQVVFDQPYSGAYLSDHDGVFVEFTPP